MKNNAKNAKKKIVSDLQGLLENAQALFVVQYKGLNVDQMKKLRRALREKDSEVKVAKGRLMKVALSAASHATSFADTLKDQLAFVFARDEVPGVAKDLLAFSKDHETLKIISGYFEEKFITSSEVIALGSLPSKEVLMAQIAAGIQNCIAGTPRAVQAVVSKMAYAMQQVAEKKQ